MAFLMKTTCISILHEMNPSSICILISKSVKPPQTPNPPKPIPPNPRPNLPNQLPPQRPRMIIQQPNHPPTLSVPNNPCHRNSCSFIRPLNPHRIINIGYIPRLVAHQYHIQRVSIQHVITHHGFQIGDALPRLEEAEVGLVGGFGPGECGVPVGGFVVVYRNNDAFFRI